MCMRLQSGSLFASKKSSIKHVSHTIIHASKRAAPSSNDGYTWIISDQQTTSTNHKFWHMHSEILMDQTTNWRELDLFLFKCVLVLQCRFFLLFIVIIVMNLLLNRPNDFFFSRYVCPKICILLLVVFLSWNQTINQMQIFEMHTHTFSVYWQYRGQHFKTKSTRSEREKKINNETRHNQKSWNSFGSRFFFILSLDGYFLIFICLCSKWILQCNKMRIMFIWYCIQRHTHTHTHSWHNCRSRWCERTLLLLHICLFDLLVSSFRGSYSW